jgi:hypothetical protein
MIIIGKLYAHLQSHHALLHLLTWCEQLPRDLDSTLSFTGIIGTDLK